ncbi:MAG: hypothetical protein MI724_02135 [Spirochaetales bacterium]|nr:hypothetical protein [Spirochaetales bacterium]
MRRLVLMFAILWSLSVAIVAAQNLPNEDERDVFAPFVSRLRVAVRDPQVRLTWRDSEDLEGGSYRVYRYTEEITQETLEAATLVATVEPGVETYLDTPLIEGDYFYAVLAAEDDGRLYSLFVPFRNKTIRPVAVTRLETEEDLATSIYDIEALVQDNTVILRFDASRTGRMLVVYRSTVPFTELSSLADATLLDEFESANRRYVDFPVPGVEYYYGVFDRVLIERGTVAFDERENVLAEPIRIALPTAEMDITVQFPRASKRRAPLPILQLVRGVQTGDNLALAAVPFGGFAQPVSVGAARAIDELLARAPAAETFDPEPVILTEERDPPGEGVAVTLSQIVTGEFAGGEYAEAASLLENLLALPLSTEMERRVRFYRGQALYLDGRSEPAFVEILAASEGALYPVAKPWIDGILTNRR